MGLQQQVGLHRGLPVARDDRGVHGRRGDGGVPPAAQGHPGPRALHHLHRRRLRHGLRLLPDTPGTYYHTPLADRSPS